MKAWTACLARLGIAGACLLVTGCGGGDVPDASSDGQAASDAGSASGVGAAAGRGRKLAEGDQAPAAEESPAEAASPAQGSPAAPKGQQGQGNSTTAEMLAMATGPSA